jgi:hypothetical protein
MALANFVCAGREAGTSHFCRNLLAMAKISSPDKLAAS